MGLIIKIKGFLKHLLLCPYKISIMNFFTNGTYNSFKKNLQEKNIFNRAALNALSELGFFMPGIPGLS